MTNFKCPHCNEEINITEVMSGEFNENIERQRISIKKEVELENLLQIREKEKIINDLKSQLDEALRKANQGSMQRQGAVQEEEIFKILSEAYDEDEFTRTGTGKDGADILQIVKVNGIPVGKIYYESKNTNNFSNGWASKLKSDNLITKADVLVIISRAMPKGVERCVLEDGVWICSFEYFKELAMALRFSLLKLHSAAIINSGRKGKMEKLYNYLTSDEFKNVFESILDGFQAIKESHQSEQITLKRMWTKREKMMEGILFSSIEFYGNLRAIAGNAIPEVKMLEAPAEE